MLSDQLLELGYLKCSMVNSTFLLKAAACLGELRLKSCVCVGLSVGPSQQFGASVQHPLPRMCTAAPLAIP